MFLISTKGDEDDGLEYVCPCSINNIMTRGDFVRHTFQLHCGIVPSYTPQLLKADVNDPAEEYYEEDYGSRPIKELG